MFNKLIPSVFGSRPKKYSFSFKNQSNQRLLTAKSQQEDSRFMNKLPWYDAIKEQYSILQPPALEFGSRPKKFSFFFQKQKEQD